MNRVDGLQFARRAAAVLVLLGVIVVAGLKHEPNELSEFQVIPSNTLRIRPLPIFLAPALIPSPVGDSLLEEPVAPSAPAAAPVRIPSRNAATLADVARSDTPYVGTLRVASTPAGASVFVNGRPVGTTPLTLSGQRAGSLALQLTRDGFQRWSAAVQVSAGQSTQINATLRPESP